MAHIATNTHGHFSLGHALAKPFVAFGNFMVKLGEMNSRADQVASLNAKTDAELKEMGLSRDTIAQHVYRDYLHL